MRCTILLSSACNKLWKDLCCETQLVTRFNSFSIRRMMFPNKIELLNNRQLLQNFSVSRMKTQSRNICLKFEYFQVQLTALNVFTVHVTCSRRGMENAIRSKLLRKDSLSGKQRDKCETKTAPRVLNLQKVCIGSF